VMTYIVSLKMYTCSDLLNAKLMYFVCHFSVFVHFFMIFM